MAIDKLKYESQNISIAREIAKYPKHLGIREAIQNAIEGDGKTGATEIQIIPLNVSASGAVGNAPKFSIWDNGVGMNAINLKKLTDMASSTKQMRGTNNPNFGRGEIAATLSYNSYGVFWISCRDGQVNLVWIRKLGEDYGRHQFDHVCEVNNSSVVININNTDLLDSLQEQYPELFTIDNSWTLKVYLGDSDAQDTCQSPFGHQRPVSINWAYNELYKRYHHIPGSNYSIVDNKLVVNASDVSIIFNKGTFSDSSNKNVTHRTFTTECQDFMKTLSSQSLDANQEVVIDKETKIAIVYNFDGKQTHNTTGKRASWNAKWRAVDSQSVSIVYHGEMYDRRDQNKFYPVMKQYGVYQGADQFKFTIILPESYDAVYPDSDRQMLKWETVPSYSGGEIDNEVTVYDFDHLIRLNMPQWFKDKIAETRKNIKTNDDLQARLQEYLNSLYTNDKKQDTPGGGNNRSGQKKGGKVNIPGGTNTGGKGFGGLKPRHDGEPMARIITPKPVFLTDKEFANIEGCENKSANYEPSQNEVLINQDYVAINRCFNKLYNVNQHTNLDETVQESIYLKIRDMVVNEFAFRTCCHVINSYYHKKSNKWEEGDVDSVYLNPAAMSAVTDSIEPFVYEALTKDVKEEVNLIVNAAKTQTVQQEEQLVA